MGQHRVRRWFVAMSGATAALIALTGCTGAGGDAGSEDHSIKIVTSVEPTNVEPCNAENGGAVILRYNVIQSLTDLDADTREIVPLLATSWEQTDDMTWVFQLREGVSFHDGEAFNADAAVFGINRSLNNETLACSNTAKVGSGVVVTPEATGEYELTITTSVPDPILPLELSYVDLVSPNTPVDEETDEPIGTGPYTWTGWNRGQSIVVDRWDDYWDDEPEVEHAELIFRQENSVRANVVNTGEADLGMEITDQDAPNGPGTKIYQNDSTFFYRLPVSTAPFDDVRVREAFSLALDRENIVPAILGRSAQPWNQMVTDTNNGYADGSGSPSYDIERAQQLLQDAAADGVDVNREFDLVAFNGQFPGSDEIQQAVQQNLDQAGFTVKLRIVDSAEWVKLLFKPFPPEQKPTVLSVKHDNSSGDASSSFTSYIAQDGCCGSATDADVDALLTTALSASGEARDEAFAAVAAHEYDVDQSIVGVASLQGIMIVGPRVEYEPNALTDRNKFALEEISFVG